MTIDETLKELEELIKRMENPASLEAAFQEYEKGVSMIKECSVQLEEMEHKVMVLSNKEDQAEEQ